ncbi:MAG: MBL fold metallo-hydrolase [Bacteroidetes bacterium]|nr:MBL fold metallo-hydrolase [Bacteroidota bacterium]
MIKFLPLGGALEIGASCFYININGTGIILDSGLHPRQKGINALPDFELIKNENVDAVLISHAHQDHIASLPFLIRNHPYLQIFMTVQSLEIAEKTLHNSSRILKEQLNENDLIVPYSHEEINLLLRTVREKDYNEKFYINGIASSYTKELEIEFYDAGHILGSAGILIKTQDGKSFFYTGDINLSTQSILNGGDLPDEKIDTLILETTYGATDSKLLNDWRHEELRLAKYLNKIFSNGGSVLVPVFALGKTQELLSILNRLMKKGLLIETNIYSGGLSKEISSVYDKHKYKVKRKNKNFELKDIPQLNLYEIKDFNEFRRNPGIVLASSGMMIKGTKSYELMKNWIKYDDFGIVIVGYMDEESPGFVFANSKKGDIVKIAGIENPVEIKCNVEKFYFPSHSKREDLIEIVKILKPENVVLIHGDPEAIDWVGHKILNEFNDIKLYEARKGNWLKF